MKSLNQKGISVIMAVLILTSVLVVALGVADVLNKSLQTGKISIRSGVAFFAAESGAEKITWLAKQNKITEADLLACPGGYLNLNTDPVDCGDVNVKHFIDPSNQNYYYKVKYSFTSPFHIYSIIGYYYNARRSIEIKYAK